MVAVEHAAVVSGAIGLAPGRGAQHIADDPSIETGTGAQVRRFLVGHQRNRGGIAVVAGFGVLRQHALLEVVERVAFGLLARLHRTFEHAVFGGGIGRLEQRGMLCVLLAYLVGEGVLVRLRDRAEQPEAGMRVVHEVVEEAIHLARNRCGVVHRRQQIALRPARVGRHLHRMRHALRVEGVTRWLARRARMRDIGLPVQIAFFQIGAVLRRGVLVARHRTELRGVPLGRAPAPVALHLLLHAVLHHPALGAGQVLAFFVGGRPVEIGGESGFESRVNFEVPLCSGFQLVQRREFHTVVRCLEVHIIERYLRHQAGSPAARLALVARRVATADIRVRTGIDVFLGVRRPAAASTRGGQRERAPDFMPGHVVDGALDLGDAHGLVGPVEQAAADRRRIRQQHRGHRVVDAEEAQIDLRRPHLAAGRQRQPVAEGARLGRTAREAEHRQMQAGNRRPLVGHLLEQAPVQVAEDRFHLPIAEPVPGVQAGEHSGDQVLGF